MANRGTTVAIRCTPDEAEAIREAAKRERRTIIAFVLNAVMTRLACQERSQQLGNQIREMPQETEPRASHSAHKGRVCCG